VYKIVATTVSTLPFEDRHVVVARVIAHGNPRNLLLTLNEWKTDSYVGLVVSLHHSVTLEVIDGQGHTLGVASSVGVKSLSSSYPLNIAVRDIFNELLNSEQISAAIASKPGKK
jgi:hypothetical protein